VSNRYCCWTLCNSSASISIRLYDAIVRQLVGVVLLLRGRSAGRSRQQLTCRHDATEVRLLIGYTAEKLLVSRLLSGGLPTTYIS
jgi:hypothetical protein